MSPSVSGSLTRRQISESCSLQQNARRVGEFEFPVIPPLCCGQLFISQTYLLIFKLEITENEEFKNV